VSPGARAETHHTRGGDSQRLQMRGEMMKAMGEIMMKYGKAMETPPKP
jgi:hypothetical protein